MTASATPGNKQQANAKLQQLPCTETELLPAEPRNPLNSQNLKSCCLQSENQQFGVNEWRLFPFVELNYAIRLYDVFDNQQYASHITAFVPKGHLARSRNVSRYVEVACPPDLADMLTQRADRPMKCRGLIGHTRLSPSESDQG